MKAIGKKLQAVMKNIMFVTFDKKNANQGYGYASAAGMIHKFHEQLVEQGLILETGSEVLHFHVNELGIDTRTNKMKFQKSAVVRETLKIVDPVSDEFVTWQGVGEGTDPGDKAIMKASTAAFKYALAHGNMLGWDAKDPEDEKKLQERKKSLKPATVKKAIASSKTMVTLESLKEDVALFRGTKDYEPLVAEWKQKKESLNG